MLSQSVDYALRAVVYLATRMDGHATTEEVAERTKVNAPYLAKILQLLVKKGILKSQRGVGGGVALVKSPETLTILEVVSAVEPIRRIRHCPLGLESHGPRLCPLHSRLDAAYASVEAAFGSTTVAEVLAEPTESIPLCDFPCGPATGNTQRIPLTTPE
jgi:Rrf2 family protein